MEYLPWLEQRIGKNWVVAARVTNRLRERYGDDVRVVTQRRMREIDREYRNAYGDPYDKPRQALYVALQTVEAAAAADGWPPGWGLVKEHVEAALKAERDRP